MGSEERVNEELKEKHIQLKHQASIQAKDFFCKQRDEYIKFFRECPQSGRYIAVFLAAIFVCSML
ncbi:hypothetical protein [uncultured Paraglaciecola sp.]|uniref:hypothetical protein n=1 Tax=uncultured Paraglaciecola sp. TaxID=1765024 RepID=UPI0026206E80|nr:hypothetical protein [uncultured Paraglaciecola sp.]